MESSLRYNDAELKALGLLKAADPDSSIGATHRVVAETVGEIDDDVRLVVTALARLGAVAVYTAPIATDKTFGDVVDELELNKLSQHEAIENGEL